MSSGFIRALAKCRSAAAYPTLDGYVFGHEMTPVVVGLVARQGDEADQGQRDRRDKDRAGPPHHHHAHPPPPACLDGALGVEEPEAAADDDHGGAQRERGDNGDEYADRTGYCHCLEVGHAREPQTQKRTGNGQARAQHHMSGPVKHRVVRGFPVFALSSGLLVSADEEDRIVGARGDRDECEQTCGESAQSDDAGVAEERDDATGGTQFHEHHQQNQDRGDDRPVDEQQHDQDHHEGGKGGLECALVTGDALIGVDRRAAGDVRLHTWRCGRRGDDVADGGNGVVGPRFTHVAAQVELHVCSLAVAALRSHRGQRVAPEVSDVLDMRGVGLELLDQLVVVMVGVGAERLVPLEDDHCIAIGVELLERGADLLHRDERRCIVGVHRHGVLFADRLERRD